MSEPTAPTAGTGQSLPTDLLPSVIFDGSLATSQIRALMGRLSSGRVANRSQGGRQLSYLEAYDVRATLIRIFGFGNFSIETLATDLLHKDLREREGQKPIWDVAVSATVRLTIHQTNATYVESAVSMQSNPDFGEAADFATKTAVSDALKRCATNLGTQFGLGLYDNGSTNEVVRVLFEPRQAAQWASIQAAQGPAVSPEQAERLAHSVGRQNDAPAPAHGSQDDSDRVPAQEVRP